MDFHELIDTCGFDAAGDCPAALLVCREEVRDMCADGRCQQYGRSWACPPACGDIGEFQRLIGEHETCHVVQTWGALEDSFDVETMMELEGLHKQRVHKLNELVKGAYPYALVLAAGTCTLCEECTYPDASCRIPEKRLVSMEAAGLVVTDVCDAAGVPYNHGPNTIAYTSCVLL